MVEIKRFCATLAELRSSFKPNRFQASHVDILAVESDIIGEQTRQEILNVSTTENRKINKNTLEQRGERDGWKILP